MRVLLEGTTDDPIALPWRAPLAGGTARPLPAPALPAELAPHYDLTLSRPALDSPAFAAFERWLGQSAAALGLSCAMIHGGVVAEAVDRLGDGRLTVGFHLDFHAQWHVADDPWARLAQAAQDAGARPINPPARARAFTDRAAAHAELRRHGLGVPETVVLRQWQAQRPLTDAERRRLGLDEPGATVWVKPANGSGGRDVIRAAWPAADGLAAAVAAARTSAPHDALLVQREVRCPALGGEDGIERPAYWRVLYCIGQLIPFWWSDHAAGRPEPNYRRLTVLEYRRHRLRPVLAFVEDLAQLCGLDWFATDVCLSEGPEKSRHAVCGPGGAEWSVVAIDSFTDRCDVDVQSRSPAAPPDAVVRYLAECFADAAWRCRHDLAPVGTGPRLRLVA